MPRNHMNGNSNANAPSKEVVTNGEVKPYKFISRLSSYPVVNDSLTYVQKNPYGQKSVQLAEKGYSSCVSPFLPYLSKPYTYVAPYVVKVDTLGHDGLVAVEHRFPIVTKDTQTVKGAIVGYVSIPIKLANSQKEYLLKTYNEELAKVGSKGYVASGKALITTGLIATSDSLAWLSSVIGKRKDQVANASKN
ncbi:hypothetical protein KEM55_006628 [Ascosphaera atra]|nr:hypothetical protein KEM55_006628 [Ascosphaera atra]